MVSLVRSLFESALKTNDYLEFAVVTGCLRISKESIFTGLNNLNVVSITNDTFAEHFGFTQEEVEKMLKDEPGDRAEMVRRLPLRGDGGLQPLECDQLCIFLLQE